MTVALSSLNYTFTSTANWQGTISGSFTSPLTNSNTPTKKITLATSVADASLGGADEVYGNILHVNPASGTQTINLCNFTDICNQVGASFARIKYFRLHVLSAADDSTNGTATSKMTVNLNTSGLFLFNLTGTSGGIVQINNGSIWEYGDSTSGGLTVTSGTNSTVVITNPDPTVSGSVLVVFVGGSV